MNIENKDPKDMSLFELRDEGEYYAYYGDNLHEDPVMKSDYERAKAIRKEQDMRFAEIEEMYEYTNAYP